MVARTIGCFLPKSRSRLCFLLGVVTLLWCCKIQAAAQTIPAIKELCPCAVSEHPDLIRQREVLTSARAHLRRNVNDHDKRCPNGMSVSSPDYPGCMQEQGTLQTAKQEHIAGTEAFNNSVDAACLTPCEVLQPPPSAEHKATNNNKESLPPLEVDQPLPEAWLRELKNQDLRNWVRANVVCGHQPIPDDFGISEYNGDLLITPEKFNSLDDNRRINLVAFELGKAFYDQMIRQNPRARVSMSLVRFSNRNAGEMGSSEYRGVSLIGQSPRSLHLGDIADNSGFAHVFRVELLQIPSGTADWNKTQQKFWEIVDPIIKASSRAR